MAMIFRSICKMSPINGFVCPYYPFDSVCKSAEKSEIAKTQFPITNRILYAMGAVFIGLVYELSHLTFLYDVVQLFLESGSNLLEFTTRTTVICILYFSVALQAFYNCFFGLFRYKRWQSLIEKISILSEDRFNLACRRQLTLSRVLTTLTSVLLLFGYIVYIGYIAYKNYNRDWWRTHKNGTEYRSQHQKSFLPQLNQQLALVSLIGPTFAYELFGRYFMMQFYHFKMEFRERVESASRTQRIDEGQMIGVFQQFNKIVSALNALDDLFCQYAFICVTVIMVQGTFGLYMLLDTMKSISPMDMHLILLLAVQLTCVTLVIHTGERTNFEARDLKTDLMVVPAYIFTDDATSVVSALKDYVSDPEWGLTGWKMFAIDKPIWLTISGVIFTHVVLLLELTVWK